MLKMIINIRNETKTFSCIKKMWFSWSVTNVRAIYESLSNVYAFISSPLYYNQNIQFILLNLAFFTTLKVNVFAFESRFRRSFCDKSFVNEQRACIQKMSENFTLKLIKTALNKEDERPSSFFKFIHKNGRWNFFSRNSYISTMANICKRRVVINKAYDNKLIE